MEDKLESEGNYVIVYYDIAKKYHINGNDLLVYSMIAGFCRKYDVYKGGRGFLADKLDITTKTVDRSLQRLLEVGLIEKIPVEDSIVRFYYRIVGERQNVPGDKKSLGTKSPLDRDKKSLGEGQNVPGVGTKSPLGRDKMSHRTKEKENIIKDENKEESIYMFEQSKNSKILLPLKDGNFYEVSEDMLFNLSRTYSEVNCLKECEKMLMWLNSNPQKRKTERGMPRFINSWIARADNNILTKYKQSNKKSNADVQDAALNEFLNSTEVYENE